MKFSELTSAAEVIVEDILGEEFVFTPRASDTPQIVTMVIEEPLIPDEVAPGDGSIVIRASFTTGAISPTPQPGDVITKSTFEYRILRVDEQIDGITEILFRREGNR